jgi:hypothetical protein
LSPGAAYQQELNMRVPILLATTLATLVTTPAHALTNGSFESALHGWTTLGDVTLYDEFVTHGLVTALIGTASATLADDAPLLEAGEANFSGASPVPATGAGSLAGALGLPANAFDNSASAVEGSAVWQDITVHAGDTLLIDWTFVSIDPRVGDYAFAAVAGQVFRLGDRKDIVFVDDGIGFSLGKTFSHVFAQGGATRLAIGVVDVGDGLGTSLVLADNARIVAAPIPEPEAYALLLTGLGLVGFAAHRNKA